MLKNKFDIAFLLRTQRHVRSRELVYSIVFLSIPAILAQLTNILMHFIDAAMVGRLGAEASASIGVVATSTWLIYGISSSLVSGFSIQVAHAIGAGNNENARSILRQSIIIVVSLSIVIAFAAAGISFSLPIWLGANCFVAKNAGMYFFVFSCTLPVMMMNRLGTSMLQCSGNMKVPSVLNMLMCLLDVVFNVVFIFFMKLGVLGAALGTSAAQITVCAIMMYFVCVRSSELSLKNHGSWHLTVGCLHSAVNISVPMAFEQIALCGAQIMGTKIVAPLGTTAIAADSFGVTAEAFCYMPGYGIGSAATTLVGQCVGAERFDLAKRFAWGTVATGIIVMSLTALCMYFGSNAVFSFFTPDIDVQKLGSTVLRIEMFSEPLFAAYIVSSHAMRGAGDTLVPCLLNLAAMWGLRLPLCVALSRKWGLVGVWTAMCLQLCFSGFIFLWRLRSKSWLKHAVKNVYHNHCNGE